MATLLLGLKLMEIFGQNPCSTASGGCLVLLVLPSVPPWCPWPVVAFGPKVSPLLCLGGRGRSIMPLGSSGAHLMAPLALGGQIRYQEHLPLPVSEERGGLSLLEKQK